ncbi:MAG: hypothetical protein Q4D90_04940 [bacterium]|nr:hypothetical protein [bacterium]
MSMLDSFLICTMTWAGKLKDDVKEFWESEDGISGPVAAIILLLIAVLLIAAFWNQLKPWVADMMSRIFGTEFDSTGLGG